MADVFGFRMMKTRSRQAVCKKGSEDVRDWNAIFCPHSRYILYASVIRVMSLLGETKKKKREKRMVAFFVIVISLARSSPAFHFLFLDLSSYYIDWYTIEGLYSLRNGWINKGLTGEQCICPGREKKGSRTDLEIGTSGISGAWLCWHGSGQWPFWVCARQYFWRS